jgi:hypothetical protein
VFGGVRRRVTVVKAWEGRKMRVEIFEVENWDGSAATVVTIAARSKLDSGAGLTLASLRVHHLHHLH